MILPPRIKEAGILGPANCEIQAPGQLAPGHAAPSFFVGEVGGCQRKSLVGEQSREPGEHFSLGGS